MPLKYTDHELKKLFYLDILPKIEGMKENKLHIRKHGIWSRVVLIASISLITYIFSQNFTSNGYLYRILPFITFIPLSLFYIEYYRREKNKFVDNYKHQIILKIITEIFPNSRFEPYAQIPRFNFEDADIFEDFKSLSMYCEDLVHGHYKNNKYEFCEFLALTGKEYEKSPRLKKYKGLFFKAQIPTKVHLNMIITPKDTHLNYSENGFQYHEVKLESPSFHNNYSVFAKYENHQIKARRFLTPKIMQQLEKYQEKIGAGFYLSIQSEMVYLYTPFSRDLFEPNFWFETDYRDIKEIAQLIEIMTEVIDHFEHIKVKEAA